MGLLDGAYSKQNATTGQGELIDLGLNSKQYYDGEDGVEGTGVGKYGNYQFVTLEDIINSFLVAYVGENKIISKIKRTDVAFHAQRALAELSFDTLKSVKSMELEVPPSLTMLLPQDYVHYTKISWIDNAGIKHNMYPTSNTSNPTSYQQETGGSLKYETNTWKVNIQNSTILDGAFFIDPLAEKQYLNKYIEYGITRSRDSFGNRITSDNDFVSKTPIPQFTSEVRQTIADHSSITNKNNMLYGVNVNQSGNSTNDGMVIQLEVDPGGLEVGMTVFAPGMPDNTTITSLAGTKSATFPGIALEITNPPYQKWKLMDPLLQPLVNPGKPLNNITSIRGKEVIFVNLNKESNTWNKYKSHTSNTNQNFDDYEDDIYWPNEGGRYGIDPQHAQSNGSYYIDDNTGLLHFSSNVSGKTIVLDYLSDSLGTDAEMRVHKFAEEAMYKCIAYAIMSTRANVQEYIVRRFQKDKFAATRKAKLRLSSLKLEELTQILRGKSKHIKH
jgi:hypothetical protein